MFQIYSSQAHNFCAKKLLKPFSQHVHDSLHVASITFNLVN